MTMAKSIAVWGAPNSGKTTFATKLARAIYDEYQSTVIVVYADMETPALPVVFPNYKKEDLFSVFRDDSAYLEYECFTLESRVQEDIRVITLTFTETV